MASSQVRVQETNIRRTLEALTCVRVHVYVRVGGCTIK